MICLGLLVALDAQAQGTPVTPTAPERPPRLDHRHQTGVAILPGIGYRVIVPYEQHKTCGSKPGDESRAVCTSALPFFLDVQASFGLTGRVDLLVDFRFGVAKDALPGVGRQFALAPGVRFWLDQDVQLKFFTTIQAVYDSTRQNQVGISDSDFALRNANGLMYDPIRNVGFYFQFGETIGFRRWFRIELDLGLGVQVRFP
jgi:hypothetical protein